MASYLATATIGEFDLRAYRRRPVSGSGTRSTWTCSTPWPSREPASQFAISQQAEPSYKRLARTIAVPAGGATLSFWITRDTELELGLRLRRGAHARLGRLDHARRTQRAHGSEHRVRLPVLAVAAPVPRALPDRQRRRYVLAERNDGRLVGGERLQRRRRAVGRRPVRLRRRRRRGVDPYASDDLVQRRRRRSSTTSPSRPGRARPPSRTTATRSTAGRCPAHRPAAPPTTTTGSPAPRPTCRRRLGESSSGRSPGSPRSSSSESSMFGGYPFSAGGGIVDDLETSGSRSRSRPVRSTRRASSPIRCRATASSCTSSRINGSATASPLARWQHIWLNEGFATYAEWLWGEHEGLATAQEIFDENYFGIPDGRPVLVADDRRSGAGRPVRRAPSTPAAR